MLQKAITEELRVRSVARMIKRLLGRRGKSLFLGHCWPGWDDGSLKHRVEICVGRVVAEVPVFDKRNGVSMYL